MKLAILGATGWIGSHILAEALSRGHEVTALVRDPGKLSDQPVLTEQFDLTNSHDYSKLQDADVVIASIGGRAAGDHSIVVKTASLLLNTLSASQRLVWVGGAGSLEVAPGVSLFSTPEFPAEYKAEAEAQVNALAQFRASPSNLKWTFVSPAAEIYPGASEGPYRLGGDAFFVGADGRSRISVTDFAKAMVDEAETGAHPQARISIAY